MTVADPPAPAMLEYAELHTPTLVMSSAGLMAIRAGVGYFVFMLAFALRRDNEPAWVFGLAAAAYGAGSFSGNVVAPILRRRWSEDRLMVAALTGAAVVAAIGALGINRRTLVVVAVVLGLAATIGRQAFDSLLQRSAPDALRGQVFARYETWFQLTWVLGGVLATAITLSIELGMSVLTILFVPIVVVYARGVREAERFTVTSPGPAVEDEVLAPAHARLVTAEAWWRAGNARLAVVEAAATVDLAVAAQSGDGIDPAVRRRLDDLRRLALDTDLETSAAEVEEALALAARSVGLSPPAPSSGSPTESDSPPE
jgi:MFS family permease